MDRAQWWLTLTPQTVNAFNAGSLNKLAFQASTGKLAAQYDAYQALPDLKLNGRLTLGENVGDLGGLAAALDACHASLGGKPAR